MSNSVKVMDDSRGPKYRGQLIEEMTDDVLIFAAQTELNRAFDVFDYDHDHISSSLKAQLEEIRKMLVAMSRNMIGAEGEEADDGHALAWFYCPSYKHLWREARKRGLKP